MYISEDNVWEFVLVYHVSLRDKNQVLMDSVFICWAIFPVLIMNN